MAASGVAAAGMAAIYWPLADLGRSSGGGGSDRVPWHQSPGLGDAVGCDWATLDDQMAPNNDRGESAGAPVKRRRRAIVWPLIVLASVLLIFSITANWVQEAVLDTDQVTATTDEILADQDVQEQLSIFAVDQLYANVDVQGQIAAQLPPPAQPLAGPLGAVARQLAGDVAERALASPQVQGLVSGAVRQAHSRFVALIEDEGTYVSTTGGEVTFEYGSVIADLAARLGLDPATIEKVQGFVQDFSQKLRDRLTDVQGRIEAVRADLSQAQGGTLDPEAEGRIRALDQLAGRLRGEIAGLERKIAGIEDKVPSQLQGKLSKLSGALSDLKRGLGKLERRTSAVLRDPGEADTGALDAQLGSLQTQVTSLLDRQVVQTPGQLVIMDSKDLDGVQTLVQALRNLGFVLPLLVVLLYVSAIALAAGWRREALIAAGGGILAATLLVLMARRLIGSEIASLASSEAVKPAVQSVYDIISESLRDRGRFILVIGLAFVGAGVFAGPGRYAVAARRFLAPHLRDHPVAAYSLVAFAFLLWVAFMPGISSLGQVIAILLLAVLAAVGMAVLRRQTAREFPIAGNAP